MDKSNAFSWENVNVEVDGKKILNEVNGVVASGELMALMGPSGSGKTTLLNFLAQRTNFKGAKISGSIKSGQCDISPSNVKLFSRYVEQDDALIGSLTVKETVDYSRKFTGLDDSGRIIEILHLLGLQEQADVRVGTPLQNGISGGQKRRLSVACQIVGQPSLLFLDEPTSGLDSTSSHQVVKAIRDSAKALNMMVIMSIHQPSTATFKMFDKVLFLSKGQMVFNAEVNRLEQYFSDSEYPIPAYFNPAEYVLDLINTDFHQDRLEDVEQLVANWKKRSIPKKEVLYLELAIEKTMTSRLESEGPPSILRQIWILTSRNFLKSRRDLLVYYARIIMYLGLATMMGTVWLRLSSSQNNIQPFINAIFFGGAFLSFMSVAYIPAFIEDYRSYEKENLNGLYGPATFVLSNFIVGLPFIFIIVILFSVVTYFMCNFRHSASGFWYYVMWLFLDLLAAESMVVFISSLFPVFVISLALTAFVNGLWMCVGGFLVSSNVLNVFWYYTFYWVNYQRYVFQGMMFNEFTKDRIFSCGKGCHCMYVSPLESRCEVQGTAVLTQLGYGKENKGLWAGVSIGIIFFFRAATFIYLRFFHKKGTIQNILHTITGYFIRESSL